MCVCVFVFVFVCVYVRLSVNWLGELVEGWYGCVCFVFRKVVPTYVDCRMNVWGIHGMMTLKLCYRCAVTYSHNCGMAGNIKRA